MRLFLFFAVIVTATPAMAWTSYFQQDLGIQGFERRCSYSNGNVYTVPSTKLCPMTIEDSPPGMGRGTGFSVGEYIEGMTKVCLYDVLGERKAIRVNSYELCPLSQRF